MSMMRPSRDRLPLYHAIGLEIKRRREAARITLKSFAAMVGTTSSTLCKIESGETACPIYILVEAANVFDCTLDDLVPVLIDNAEVA